MPHGGGGGRADAWRAKNRGVREKDARVSSSFSRNRVCHAGTQSEIRRVLSQENKRLGRRRGRDFSPFFFSCCRARVLRELKKENFQKRAHACFVLRVPTCKLNLKIRSGAGNPTISPGQGAALNCQKRILHFSGEIQKKDANLKNRNSKRILLR